MQSGEPDLADRTALVTGATSGIGLEIGRLLARRGARVLAGCRSRERFERAQASIEASDDPEAAARVSPAGADLASDGEVERLATEVARTAPPIDFLFLNAGIHDVAHRLTADGRELTYATNFLGHFRLLHRLAAAGRLAPDARILVTQSEAVHANPFARAAIDALEHPNSTPLRRALWRATASPNSKVLLALTAVDWERRVAGTALARRAPSRL